MNSLFLPFLIFILVNPSIHPWLQKSEFTFFSDIHLKITARRIVPGLRVVIFGCRGWFSPLRIGSGPGLTGLTGFVTPTKISMGVKKLVPRGTVINGGRGGGLTNRFRRESSIGSHIIYVHYQYQNKLNNYINNYIGNAIPNPTQWLRPKQRRSDTARICRQRNHHRR